MLAYKVEMNITPEQQDVFEAGNACHICNEFVCDEDKVHDHNHLTGKYCGIAHNACNLNYCINPKTIQIPYFLHNMKHYDAHLIISAIKERHGKVSCIPSNMEN